MTSEAAVDVVRQAVFVDVEAVLVAGLMIDVRPPSIIEAVVAVAHRDDAERLDVDARDEFIGSVADAEAQSPHGQCVRERGGCEVDADTSVEVGAVGAVHLAPSPGPVGSEPEVWLVEVAEQQELPDLPDRRDPHHIVRPLAAQLTGCGPSLVLPAQREGFVAVVVPALPSGGEAVCGKGGEGRGHADNVMG